MYVISNLHIYYTTPLCMPQMQTLHLHASVCIVRPQKRRTPVPTTNKPLTIGLPLTREGGLAALCFWMKMGQASSSSHSTDLHGWVHLKRRVPLLCRLSRTASCGLAAHVCERNSGSSGGDAWIDNNPPAFPIMQPVVLTSVTKQCNLHAVNPWALLVRQHMSSALQCCAILSWYWTLLSDWAAKIIMY